MKYDCVTRHGPALAKVSRSGNLTVVKIQWLGTVEEGDFRQIEYRFELANVPIAGSDCTDEYLARLTLAHFNRTAEPVPKSTMYFRVEDMKPDDSLNIVGWNEKVES